MKKIIPKVLSWALLLCFFSPLLAQSRQNIDEWIALMQKSLNDKDIPAYLNFYSPELREEAGTAVRSFFDVLEMENVTFFMAHKRIHEDERASLFLQVLFQNAYSAQIETWQLQLQMIDNRWQIREKVVTGNIANLFKIRIPSDNIERVGSLEIEHLDIRMSFRDALLFYDNIPGLQTALLVIGKGRLHYSPSDPTEKHQLGLIFKSDFIEDRLEYAFLRFSNSFFRNNIRITGAPERKQAPPTQAELNWAYSLFTKHYQRSFTVENSLSGELLSFVPQGEEAVFEFKGEKTGDLTYIYSPFAREEVTLYDRRRERIINLYSPRSGEGKKRFFIAFDQKFDVTNYLIELDFNPRLFYLSAKARIEGTSRMGTLDILKFKLNPDLEILRIHDEEGRELFYTQDRLRKILYVYMIKPLSRGDTFSVGVNYRGNLEPPPATSDIIPGPQFFKEPSIFVPPRYESILFSQSAYWYPSPPDDDYFTARVKFIIPPDYSCISNGELVEKGSLNGLQGVVELAKMGSSIRVFETKCPVKYLAFIVGKLTKVQEKSDSLPVRHYVSSEIRFPRRGIFEDTLDILQAYERWFGPFPYEKLSVVQRVWPTSGGHSPASFVVLNELPRGDKAGNIVSPVDLSRYREYFIAHEIAHQWWGQGVTWATYRDQWLSEGLAQFSSILYLKEKYGERVFAGILRRFSQWTQKKTRWGPIILGSRLSFYDFEAYQTIIYNKASLALNMLLELLGEEVFFACLREFFDTFKYGAATTKDFQGVMERVSGRNLSLFFKGWFESHELPEARVSCSVHKKEGEYFLGFRIHQPKDVFVFPLWLEWRDGGNRIRRKIIVEERIQEYEFRTAGRPRRIKINPDMAVPGKFQ